MIDYQNAPAQPAKKSGGSPVMAIICGVLALALIAVGVLYGIGIGKLNKANDNIAALEANVSSLETQLASEKTTVASLQAELSAEKDKVAKLTADLADANENIASLEEELSAAEANVSRLTADLADAEADVAAKQASLDEANADLAAALSENDSLSEELVKVKFPRHFSSVSELNSWLAQDDTNTNPEYAVYDLLELSYILQVKALQDGYILSVYLETDGVYSYVGNEAVIGNAVYLIDAETDEILMYFSGFPAPQSYPLTPE